MLTEDDKRFYGDLIAVVRDFHGKVDEVRMRHGRAPKYAASTMSAGTVETRSGSGPKDRQRGPRSGDAQSPPDPPTSVQDSPMNSQRPTTLFERMAAIARGDFHERLAAGHPSLTRGRVWCRSCGASQTVDSADALRHGWPKCCNQTMTIDSPEEQPQ